MIDLSQYIGDIARRLLGSPNPEHSTREQLRFGTNGSIAVEIAGPDVGTWYNHEHKRGGGPMQLLSLEGGMLPVAAREWLKAELGIELEEPKPKSRQQVVSTYDYVDESGQLLSQAVRKGPVKRFHQRAPDGNGGWKVGPDGKWTIKGVRLVPYRLTELVAAVPEATIYIVEGEKDVDNLRSLGCVATCNPMGAGKWPMDFAEHFHGRNVVILPDNDETGRDHALDVVANLAPVAASVLILELPGLPEKGDVSDWLTAGGTREQLEQLAAAAPAFDPNMVRPRTSKPDSDREPRDIRVFLGAPYEIAGIFLGDSFTHESHRTLYYWRGSFYEWTGCAYPEAETENLRSRLYDFLATRCYCVDPKGNHHPVNPSPKLINAVLDGLRAKAHLPTSISAPAWLGVATEDQRTHDPKDIVACSNGLLHLPTMTLLQHTPTFFCHNSLEFPFDPDAPAPLEWHEFIGKLWPGDFNAIDTMHEMFGYFLTGDTSQQKIFSFVGPPRCGKGTIAKILRRLLGEHNCTAPTLSGLGTEFGLQPLIGKLAAIIGDARLGARSDMQSIVERLLSISGEDELNVNRKNLTHWTGQLITRVLIISNEVAKLTDASSALANRFITLRMTESFLGREDLGLLNRLIPELPGILNLAIKGWRRLRNRGYFQQPASSQSIVEQFEDLSSPVKQFVRERCVLDDGYEVSRDALFAAYVNWCRAEGRDHSGNKVTFGRDLSAAFPKLGDKRSNKQGDRTRLHTGIKLVTVSAWSAIYTLCIWGVDFNDALPQRQN